MRRYHILQLNFKGSSRDGVEFQSFTNKSTEMQYLRCLEPSKAPGPAYEILEAENLLFWISETSFFKTIPIFLFCGVIDLSFLGSLYSKHAPSKARAPNKPRIYFGVILKALTQLHSKQVPNFPLFQVPH